MMQDSTLRLLKALAMESLTKYYWTRLSLSSNGATMMQGSTLRLLKAWATKALSNNYWTRLSLRKQKNSSNGANMIEATESLLEYQNDVHPQFFLLFFCICWFAILYRKPRVLTRGSSMNILPMANVGVPHLTEWSSFYGGA
jgi:hypothetical protein